MNILTRITDWKIPCVYIHVYQIIKNRGPGPYNSLRHADNRKYFAGHCLTQNRREAHMIYMAKEVEKIWKCSCWEKGNFVMINDFKYGQSWKISPSPLSLSIYSTFNDQCSHHIETSKLICIANQLTGFYMMGTLVVKGLNSKNCVSRTNTRFQS